MYTYVLNNDQTNNHRSIVFGIRQLTTKDFVEHCFNGSMRTILPVTDEPVRFTSNYQLRVYTTGCYYLDNQRRWQSDGLTVVYSIYFYRNSNRIISFICYCLVWFIDNYQSNSLFINAFDNVCRWFSCFTCSDQLELCIFQC
jgi:hypothetical protein